MRIPSFRDLVFDSEPILPGVHQAVLFAPNGYGISVIYGPYTYSDRLTYEVAVIKGNEDKFEIVPEMTGTDESVLGWQTPSDINKLINKIWSLK